MAGQSHKWMCSSKSAKNVMSSCSHTHNNACSLGPKSELKQAEQANAENKIKILHNNSAKPSSCISKPELVGLPSALTPVIYMQQPGTTAVVSDDGQALAHDHPMAQD